MSSRLQPDLKVDAFKAISDPVWFAECMLGVKLWEKQKEILRIAVSNPEGAVRLAVRSCHGSGKSFVLATLVLWFTCCHPNSEAFVTANTWEQATSTIWAEVRRLHYEAKVPLGGEMLKTQWVLGPKWFANVVSPGKPEAASGRHAQAVLIVVDEASGLGADMAEAFEGNMSSGNVILVYSGNPIRPSGPFYDAFRGTISKHWEHIHVSALNAQGKFNLPTDVPGLTNQDWVNLRREEWGEGSPAWQSRVLGDFPDASEDSLIPLSLITAAEEMEHTRSGKKRMGVDTARFGGDSTVIVVRDMHGVLHVREDRGLKETEIAGLVGRLIDENAVDPADVNVDNTGGYGAGAVDILEERGIKVNGVNFGAKANDPDQFSNVRAEMYWHLMLALRDDEFSLRGAGTAMGGQLAAIRKMYDSSGRVKLEAKEKVKARVGRSPDHADALALSFAPPREIMIPQLTVI